MIAGRILIVDDEPKLVRLLREILLATGFEPVVAYSGQKALEMVVLEQPVLVLLDIMLNKDMDGFEVARRIREFSDIPIIMLTAMVKEADKLRGFEMGADDYITKPFSARELIARIQAVLKRSQAAAVERRTEMVFGELHINLLSRSVSVNGQDVHLTPTEYNLLHELAVHANQVLFHKQLLSSIWGPEYQNDVDYLRSYVHCIRKKIEPDPSSPKLIQSMPGVGYMFVAPDTESSIS